MPYAHVGQFSEGLAPVYAYVSTNDDNMKFGYIDKTGKLAIPLKFSHFYGDKLEKEEYQFKNGKAKVMDFKGQTGGGSKSRLALNKLIIDIKER